MEVLMSKSGTFSDVFSAWGTQAHLGTSKEAKLSARYSLVDTHSCTVYGAHEQQAISAADAMKFGLAVGSCEPIGGGDPLSLQGAALVNGARAHAIDFDDYELSGSSHASSPIFSALFSLVRIMDLTIDEVCDAWLVGYEAIVWIGKALGYGHYDAGWHSTSTLGPIGTAAAVSKALRLSATQMGNAMAIAASSSAGLKSQFGYDAKAIHVGLAAEAGLRAALLARANASGNRDLWDSEYGFSNVYGTTDSIGFDEMLRSMKLGEGVDIYPVVRKLWPSCAYTHRPILGAARLHNEVGSIDEIDSITVRMPRPFQRVARFRVPTNDAEARFSINYCVIVGLINGHVTPEDFREHKFSEPVRRKLADMVQLDLYDLPKGDSGDIGPTTPEKITVVLKDGRRLEREILYVPGGTHAPMTEDQLLQKVADCDCSVEEAVKFLEAPGSISIRSIGLLDQKASPSGSGQAGIVQSAKRNRRVALGT